MKTYLNRWATETTGKIIKGRGTFALPREVTSAAAPFHLPPSDSSSAWAFAITQLMKSVRPRACVCVSVSEGARVQQENRKSQSKDPDRKEQRWSEIANHKVKRKIGEKANGIEVKYALNKLHSINIILFYCAHTLTYPFDSQPTTRMINAFGVQRRQCQGKSDRKRAQHTKSEIYLRNCNRSADTWEYTLWKCFGGSETNSE